MPGYSKKSQWLMKGMLREWYGEETARNEILAYRPSAIPLSESIDKVMGELVSPADLKLMEIKEKWESVAGAQIANIATPLNVRGKLLYVEVKRSLWLRELRGPAGKMLMENIKKLCGPDFCNGIKFVPSSGR
jgi:predicted nucleic acid-binding Zn ribbon protein